MKPRTVHLQGGPFDGQHVPEADGSTLNIDGPGVPDGQVARYRPSRQPGVYTFRGLATVIARIEDTERLEQVA